MNADPVSDGELETEDDFEDENEKDSEDGVSLSDDGTDNVGDPSVEINVEELISELESQGFVSDCTKESHTKRRLEDLVERRLAKRALEDFDDYEF